MCSSWDVGTQRCLTGLSNVGDWLIAIAIATVLCPVLMFLLLRARGVATISPLEPGMLFAAVVTAYAVLPLTGIILCGDSLELNLDARLANISATPADIAQVALLYLGFLGGFCFFYALVRSPQGAYSPGEIRIADWRLPAVIAGVAVFVVVFLPQLLRQMFGVDAAEDYLGTYVELVGQPIWVQQLFGMATSIGNVLVIAAIAAVLAYNRKLIGIVAAVVILWALNSIFGGGSRLAAMVALLSLAVAYSFLVRPISLRLAAVLGVGLIFVFLAGQYLRDFSNEDSIRDVRSALVNGEFASVYLNVFEMAQQRDWLVSHSALPNLYAVDIARLIPQQLLPFEKVDPSRWYVSTFYPDFAATGGGLAFGAVAESALGFGLPEALVRGGLLGVLFAIVHGYLGTRFRRSLLGVIVYIWLVVLSYNSFRDTTFVLLGRFAFHVVPALLVIVLVQRLLRAFTSSRAAGLGGHDAAQT
jgi:hypothetical protein